MKAGVVFAAAVLVAVCQAKLPEVKPDVCANVMCGAGRECTEKDGEPTCICIRKCPSHNKPVCGSNAKSYINHCELHKHACEAGIKIQIKYSGKCKEGEVDDTAVLPTVKPTKPSQPTNDVVPVVCFAQNRNLLREKISEWIMSETVSPGWFQTGVGFDDVTQQYFQSFDKNSNGKLDSNEFLAFVERNETAAAIDATSENEVLLRGLCVDALIDISDDDSDWELNLKEFRHCLEPGFLPPQKKCSLEEEQYDDGAETQVNCNSCVCACGNWVCTALKCDPTQAPPTVGPSKKDDLLEKSPEELLEEEWDEYVKLLGDNGPKAPAQDHSSQEEEEEDWSIEDDMDEIFPRKKHRKHKKGIKLIKEKVRFD
ncbi:PREDICTED: follistatin-related protein 1-like isoform X1 [Branchiostoma belcheri]|uniref:Follistatin-related protein 1 n=1 Tax=Branchiostoma belcheri TaxID=7741 RepID=A0A6P4YK31_BRABE|nr:PREDICTED: follistatin-related protein 1-like isoform X1 [Branchiostoma belcheri]